MAREQFDSLRSTLGRERPRPVRVVPTRLFVVLVAVAVVGCFALWRAIQVVGQPPLIPFGEEARIEPFVYSVLKVETQRSIGTGSLARRSEGVYKIVTLTARNENDQPHAVSEAGVSILDAAGIEYLPVCRTDFGSCVEDLPQTFTQRFLLPGEELIGIFIFDVDTEATGFHLKILRDPFAGTYTLFDLD